MCQRHEGKEGMDPDFSLLYVSGGSNDGDLRAYDSSTVHFSGGEIDNDTYAYDSSTVHVSGGEPRRVHAYNSSTVNILGGSLRSLEAGSIDGIHTSVITIAGTDFNYPYGPLSDSSGTLTGIVASGESIDVEFEIYSNAAIVLVPESGTAALLSLAVVGLLPHSLRRRKRAR